MEAPCGASSAWPPQSATSRSGPGTWRSPWTAPTRRSRPSWTRRRTTRAARGATAAGAELFELAAALDPGDAEASRQRRLQAAKRHRLAGDVERAATLLEQLLTETASGVERADVLFELALTFQWKRTRLIELCDEALVHAGGDDARQVRILGERAAFKIWVTEMRGGLDDARAGTRARRTGR